MWESHTPLKRIAIDVRMAHHTGIGRYIRGFVPKLEEGRPPEREYVLLGYEKHHADFPSHFKFVQASSPVYSIREQWELPYLAHSYDCIHIPHYNAPLFNGTKLIITVHDLIHLHFQGQLPSLPARVYARTVLPWIVQKASAIITVSEYTRVDLIKTLNVHPEKITVIHHGIDSAFLDSQKPAEQTTEKSAPYFLYVGLLKTHKNIGVLLDAFQKLKKKHAIPELRLQLIGKADTKQSVVRKWLEIIKGRSDISLVCGISDEELRNRYRNALAFVLPSLYEGFGFPLLEAAASKIPIIGARTSSIPEVMGEDAALYFDPYSASELESQMKRVLMDESLRDRLIQEGLKRLSLFDWQTASQKTVNVYESVLNSNK